MLKIRTILGIVVLIFFALLVWVAFQFQSLPERPNVSIKLVGYTNDSAGTRLAMITVTNLSNFEVYVYRPIIQIRSQAAPNEFTNYFQGNTNQWARFYSKLNKRASGNFTIPPPPPSFQSPWRLSFLVYSDFAAVQMVKRFIAGRRMPFQIESDLFENEK